MTLYMGIDGGGSNLRVAIVDEALNIIAQAHGETANPSTIGHDTAAARIQGAMREVLAANTRPIASVGIGVAGASTIYAEDWLRATIATVLPSVPIAASMDTEIALVGAHGARRGAMVLAGTGSVAFAVNAAGEHAQAGGWGYLLGDEGGGYWLVTEALRLMTRAADGLDDSSSPLAAGIAEAFGFVHAVDVVPWLYRHPPPIRDVAARAGVVLDAAAAGDPHAHAIIARGAAVLADIVMAAIRRVSAEPSIRFCGGLLASDNPLSRALCRQLGLDDIPYPLHPPVVGAALLAKLTSET